MENYKEDYWDDDSSYRRRCHEIKEDWQIEGEEFLNDMDEDFPNWYSNID